MNHEKNGYSIVSGHVRISVNDNMYAVGNPWPMEKSDGMWPSGKRLVWNM